jgi:acetyl-CoA carboxylase biotin carboxyl carrier protein
MSPEFIEKVVILLQKHSLRAFEFEQAGACLNLKFDAKANATSAASHIERIEEEPCNIIFSPSMGVLRLTHPQREESFVKVGSEIKEGQIVAFLQNDELLEEVKANCSGVLVAAVAQEGQVIGFAQPLFELR